MPGQYQKSCAHHLALLFALCLIGLLLLGLKVPVTDFGAFWFAGTSLVHAQNPYDTAAALQAQRATGMDAGTPWVMRNLPSALFLTLPLGLLPYKWAWLFWTACLIGAIAFSATLCWRLYGGDSSDGNQLWIAWLLSFSFAPVLACLVGRTTRSNRTARDCAAVITPIQTRILGRHLSGPDCSEAAAHFPVCGCVAVLVH